MNFLIILTNDIFNIHFKFKFKLFGNKTSDTFK